MLQIGLPAGLQGMVFSISNILIQSAVNSLEQMLLREAQQQEILKLLDTL